MRNRTYHKAPLTFDQQLALLKSRGLVITDKAKAIAYLKEISYYRLSAYFLPYQQVKDQFNTGVTFQQIIQTYAFDRELRLLVFDCIERIEVAIRTQIIYVMALKYNDSHWHDKKRHFKKPYYNKVGRSIDPYRDFQEIIARSKNARRPEIFIKHYANNYDSPANPPAWMCLELPTIGELSHLYKGLKSKADKKEIAFFFNLHPTVFSSWLHSLTYVRNLCAHHSRLWNRDLAIEPTTLEKATGPWVDKAFEINNRTFYFLCVLKYLLNRANPGNSLKMKLDRLFEKYPSVPKQYLGIPSNVDNTMQNWKEQPIWKNETA